MPRSGDVPDVKIPQLPADSASAVTDLITRLKENLRERSGSWWRDSMTRVTKRPLLASYQTSSKDMVCSTREIQDELTPVRHCRCTCALSFCRFDVSTLLLDIRVFRDEGSRVNFAIVECRRKFVFCSQGPNESSIFSSNWHDRLQWSFQQVLNLRESQESRPASQLRRKLFERELALSQYVCPVSKKEPSATNCGHLGLLEVYLPMLGRER